MVILDIFTKNLSITYKSTLFSKATFAVLLFGAFSVALPFIFAYKSGGFWLKRDVFHVKPDVKFKGDYFFAATTSDLSHPIICSTIPYISENLEHSNDGCSLIRVHESDKNLDGKVDELNFKLSVILPRKTYLTSISIIVFIDYKLHDPCPLQMEAFIIFQQFLSVIISELTAVGNLKLIQSEPLFCHKYTKYNYPMTNEKFQIDHIITEYARRNVSTTLADILTDFQTGNTEKFNLHLQVRYPEDRIYYKPHFWNIIKWAWIQYLAIYLIVSYLIAKIKCYIFNKKLVLFYEDNPLKKCK